MGKVRIIAGDYKRRILQFNDNIAGLRPTPDRVRETLFNWLGQELFGETCLDLFAGSGALGFEAISRGAKFVTLVDTNKEILKNLQQNARLLNLNNLKIVECDSIRYLSQIENTVDVIFLDPPYDTELLDKCLRLIENKKSLFEPTLIYIEYRNIPDLNGYQILKSAKAGGVNYALLQLIS